MESKRRNMSWYAVDSVDDAIDATRSFLFPFDLAAWLKLALISLFVSVSGSFISSILNLSYLLALVPSEPAQQEAVPTDPAVIAAIVGVVVLFGLALAVFSETLRFVFYDALRTGTVRLRGPASRRFGQAFRLFGFKLLALVGFALPSLVIGVSIVLSTDFLDETVVTVGRLLTGVVVCLSVITYLIVMRVTNEFVVPVMVLTDSGVLNGWRRFWPVLRSQLSQFGVYVVVHFLLLLAISVGQSLFSGIIFSIVGTLGALIGLAVVFGAFGGFGAAVGSTGGAIAVGLIVFFTLLVAFVLYVPVMIAVLTYVITYEVSVLAAADEDLQLLSDNPNGNTESPPPVV